jgi:hypothetical protein
MPSSAETFLHRNFFLGQAPVSTNISSSPPPTDFLHLEKMHQIRPRFQLDATSTLLDALLRWQVENIFMVKKTWCKYGNEQRTAQENTSEFTVIPEYQGTKIGTIDSHLPIQQNYRSVTS